MKQIKGLGLGLGLVLAALCLTSLCFGMEGPDEGMECQLEKERNARGVERVYLFLRKFPELPPWKKKRVLSPSSNFLDRFGIGVDHLAHLSAPVFSSMLRFYQHHEAIGGSSVCMDECMTKWEKRIAPDQSTTYYRCGENVLGAYNTRENIADFVEVMLMCEARYYVKTINDFVEKYFVSDQKGNISLKNDLEAEERGRVLAEVQSLIETCNDCLENTRQIHGGVPGFRYSNIQPPYEIKLQPEPNYDLLEFNVQRLQRILVVDNIASSSGE